MTEASFSIAIVRGGEGGVVHGVHSLLPSRLCWAGGVELEWDPRSPPASPRPMGQQTWCEGLLQISMQKKKKIQTSARLGPDFQQAENICPAVLPSLALSGGSREGPLWPRGHDAHKAHLHCCLSPVILYTP